MPMFTVQKTFIPIYKGGSKVHLDSSIISFIGKRLYNTDIVTNLVTIKEFQSEISYITYHQSNIQIGFIDGSVHTDYFFTFHKSVITYMHNYNNILLTCSSDKTAKLSVEDQVISTVYCKNIVACGFVYNDVVVVSDVEGNIYKKEGNNGYIQVYCGIAMHPYKMMWLDDKVYCFSREIAIIYGGNNGKVTDVFRIEKKNTVRIGGIYYNDHEVISEDVILHNNLLHFIYGNEITVYDLNMKKMSQNLIRLYKEKENQLLFKNLNFTNQFIVTTIEDEILFLDEKLRVESAIIGNNDEITDIRLVGNKLFIGTNGERLRYMEISDEDKQGSYCCRANLFEGHEGAIMSIAEYDGRIVTASRDKKVIVWDGFGSKMHFDSDSGFKNDENIMFEGYRLHEDVSKKIKYNEEHENLSTNIDEESKIYQQIVKIRNKSCRIKPEAQIFESHIDSVNSCDISKDIIVTVGADRTLQIFTNTIKPKHLITKVIHEKEINAVMINETRRIIATASHDKTVRIFNYEGEEKCVLALHRRGVWTIDMGVDLIASGSSDETIRIWSLEDYECIRILEGHNSSIIKVKFYEDSKKLLSCDNGGLIKAWDVRRGKLIASIDFHKDKVWSIIVDKYIFSASIDGSIRMIKDEVKKTLETKKTEENNKKIKFFEMDVLKKNQNYIKALEIAYEFDDYIEIFNLLEKCVQDKMDIKEIFMILENDRIKLLKIVKKYLKIFKHVDVMQPIFQEMLRRKYFNQLSNKEFVDILQKIYKNADDLSIALNSMELLFKDIIVDKFIK